MIVIKFCGGIGNQMFQYAFYRKYKSLGCQVKADLTFYDMRDDSRLSDYVLQEAFPQLVIEEITEKELDERYLLPHKKRNYLLKIEQQFIRKNRLCEYELKTGIYKEKYLKFKHCYLTGYWQTEKYWEDISDIIRKEFCTDITRFPETDHFKEYIKHNKTVSVHIRRGDYLLPGNQRVYGGICDNEYYTEAINYFSEKYPEIRFIYFSNDIPWVKNNFDMKNGIVANELILGNVPDWCEIFLMSACNHNIIANSSFSWWGAYLNQYADKEVIAPRKWFNTMKAPDICPQSWIRL